MNIALQFARGNGPVKRTTVDDQVPSTGTAQRVEAFQRVPLRGRPLPDDLRALLVAYREEHPAPEPVFRLWELDLLDPSEPTWLGRLSVSGHSRRILAADD
jgi:hypothetical protein